MNNEDLNAAFEKFDANGDGYIVKEEFVQAVLGQGLTKTEEEIDAFLIKLDTNKDGKISREEFVHYFEFHRSQLNDFPFLLDLTTSSVAMIRRVDSFVDVTKEEESNEHPIVGKFVLRDNHFNGIDGLKTTFQLHVGGYTENKHIPELLKQPLSMDCAIGFKFHVKNRELIRENFSKYFIALKEFATQAVPQLGEVLEALNLQFIDEDDGVIMLIDPMNYSFGASYVGLMRMSLENIIKSKSNTSIMFGTEQDLFNKSITYRQLLESGFYLESNSKSIQLNSLLIKFQKSGMFNMISNLEDTRALNMGIIIGSSFRSSNVEIDFDAVDRKDLANELGLEDLDQSIFEDKLNKGKNQLVETGISDMIDSLDFIKNAVKDLHEGDCSSISFFTKIDQIYTVLNFKGEAYQIFSGLLNL